MPKIKRRRGSRGDPGRRARRRRLVTRTHVGDEPSSRTEESASTSSVAGDLDDDKELNEDSIADEIICYGSLCEVTAQLLPEVQAKIRKNLPRNRIYHSGRIDLYEGEYALHLHESGPIAYLDTDTASTMRQISGQPFIRATAIIGTAYLDKEEPLDSKSVSFPLSINILGPRTSGSIIGDVLARNDAFLQHPQWLQTGIRYINPQYYPPDLDLTEYVGLTENELRARLISKEFEGILASLDGGGVEDGVDLRGLKTKLKSHQRVALGFIHRRESQEECRRLDAELQLTMNLLTGDKTVYPTTGGILADVMGLGKTLTMLCTILRTREHAASYRMSQTQNPGDGISHFATEATLVVVTSTQIMNVWMREMQTHFEDGVLKTLVFHGPQRTVDPMNLSDQNLVLTTYGTLVADAKGRRILQKMAWYRVILDEAHWICNHTAQSSMAARDLITEKRWCITGTPIQNRLEDLVSLLRFLRVRPFDNSAIFRKHILEPLRGESLDPFRNMKALLHAVCLRRDEKYLGLPEATYEIRIVKLSPQEKTLYDAAMRQSHRENDEVVSGNSQGKRCAILFKTMMELRRLCNHGALPVAMESKCDFCYTAEEDKLALLCSYERCPYCDRDLRKGVVSMRPRRSYRFRQPALTPSPPRDVEMTGMTDESILAAAENGTSSDSGLPAVLSSSKLDAVAKDLSNSDCGSKSLVFSFWTATLDLLRKKLADLSLPSLQIDGRVSYDERQRILERFSQPGGPAILLMSIKTGAVGLTITAANRIYLIEPQWNPSVEQQAIARVLRMGQQRQVTVIRYIVEKTVEEGIIAMQKKKSKLAKFMLDSESDNDKHSRLQDLKFVLDSSPWSIAPGV